MNFTKNTRHNAQARVRTKERDWVRAQTAARERTWVQKSATEGERESGRERERELATGMAKKCRSNEHVSSCRSTWQQWSESVWWSEVRYVVLWWVGVGVGRRVERHTSTNKLLDYVTLPTKYIDNITHTPPSSLSVWVCKPASQQQQQTAVDSQHSVLSLSLSFTLLKLSFKKLLNMCSHNNNNNVLGMPKGMRHSGKLF